MKKIRELIDTVGRPSQVNKSNSAEEITIGAPLYAYKDEARSFLRNPQADLEAIESIDEVFFGNPDLINPHELEKLTESITLTDVEIRRTKLRQQLNAISKKLSDVILENQPSYTKELKDVQELQRSLHNAFVICSNGRRFLISVSLRSTTAALGVLSHQQRKQKLLALCTALETIRTLQHTDVRLREMLEEEDYDGAIQLCLECQEAASTYKHYHCIKDLSSKLQDTLEQTEEQIDVALSKTCKSFDENLYTKLQLAYQLLGKKQSAMDQLLMHYTTCIHNTAFQIVLGFAELGNASDNLQKKQYKDICVHVTGEMYIPCLMELCKGLWSIMCCYHKTSKWHLQGYSQNYDEEEIENYLNRKLNHGRHRVWADVQSRIRTYILSCDLSSFKYDDFITVLDIVKRFISVGEDFFQNIQNTSESQPTTDSLNEPLRKQTLSYFRNHHQNRLDELLMFLDNEAWQPCPVKSTFDVLGMQEFRFLRKFADGLNFSPEVDEHKTADVPGSKFFDPYLEKGHPFLDLEKTSLEASNMAVRQTRCDSYELSDEEDTNDELHQEFVDERTGETPLSSPSSSFSLGNAANAPLGPIVTNTALHILRLCGSYMKMCDVLKPIAIDVVVCMTQLFDLYLYAIYQFFSTDSEREKYRYQRLTPTIQRIEESLFYPVCNSENDIEQQQIPGKIARPTSLIDLCTSENNYAITERIVATESLVCLSEQLQSLQPYLEQLIPQSKKAFLDQFYSQTVKASVDVRWTAYQGFAEHSIDTSVTIAQMALVSWDIRDIMSQHNSYVDELLNELTIFKSKLTQFVRSIHVPDAVNKVIWNHCILISNQVFVEGFSNVKRCSNEGRALMQLDYQQFLLKLEKLANIRPIPYREFVEAYIKAYYLTESDLEDWMQLHTEYTPKQLSALVNCSAASYVSSSTSLTNRKTKQRMKSLIDELTNRK